MIEIPESKLSEFVRLLAGIEVQFDPNTNLLVLDVGEGEYMDGTAGPDMVRYINDCLAKVRYRAIPEWETLNRADQIAVLTVAPRLYLAERYPAESEGVIAEFKEKGIQHLLAPNMPEHADSSGDLDNQGEVAFGD